MKLTLIYNKNDYKLSPASYSKNYYDLFTNLLSRFDEVQLVTENCSKDDIEGDVIIFFDPHSSHHIRIDGIADHSALKYEYYNDPHQKNFAGQYVNGPKVVKLGAEKRTFRSKKRGIDFIICPVKSGYDKYIKPHLGDRLVWFPIVPAGVKVPILKLSQRKYGVLANGHLWQGANGFNPYLFRNWAYKREGVTFVPHYAQNKNVPIRDRYMKMLNLFKGGLALCDVYPVAKYFEFPLMGCVTFMQKLPECEELGFVDGVNCIFVDKSNFDKEIGYFNEHPQGYQNIADAGRELVESRWTAERFADFIYRHAENNL